MVNEPVPATFANALPVIEPKNALAKQYTALLETEGLVSLEQVMHDGTKIRAQAGVDTFRREKSLRERLAAAREAVKQMGDPRDEAPARNRKQAAQERAVRERLKRLEPAAAEMEALQAEKTKPEGKEAVQVSLTEPEARKMKHGDNANAPSYNGGAQDHRRGACHAVQQRCQQPDAGNRGSDPESGEGAGAGGGGWGVHESGKHPRLRRARHRSGRLADRSEGEERGVDEGQRDRSKVCAALFPDLRKRGAVGVSGGM